MSELICFAGNRFQLLSEAGMPLTDLGVQRGYGIFDFLRVSGNTPLFIEDHLDRFFHSATEMRLPLKQSVAELKQLITELIEKNRLPVSGIRIMLSGGNSPDGYKIIEPNLAIVQQPITAPGVQIEEKGFSLVTYPHQRQMPEVKTTDYLMAVWLYPWVKEQGADEVLYQQNDYVSECPRSNFFIVTENDTLVTPASGILKGVTRKNLLLLASQNGMKTEERPLLTDEIYSAKEAFISSSTKRLIPVHTVNQRRVGDGTTGAVSRKLYQLFFEKEKQLISG